MTLQQANRKVANLLDEETADEFEHRLYDFYDYAQKQIATTVDHIEEIIKINPVFDGEFDIAEQLYERTGKRLYKICKITTDADFKHLHKNSYQFYAGREYTITCYVYPETITEDTEPSYEFEISPEAQSAIIYYAAAQTMLTDTDQRPYYSLIDRYNNILQNISDVKRENINLNVVKLGGNHGI